MRHSAAGGEEQRSAADWAAEAVAKIREDICGAHKVFFQGDKETVDAPYHREIIKIFWLPGKKQILGFRGCGKSTKGERNMALAAALKAFNNILIVGSNEDRASERLAVVGKHLTMNPVILPLFGDMKGYTWHGTKLVLRGGNCVQALGRDQDIRGIKHMDWRPDFVFVDDFEDKESVQTPEQRRKTFRWFLGDLLLACEPDARILVNGTPLDAESVPMRLWREAEWPTRIIPIEYLDDSGERKPAWPQKFPLTWIDEQRKTYVKTGEGSLWASEMMCDPRSRETMTFAREMFRVEPRVRSWQAVYAMVDPARTTYRTSATTGWAVWSWILNRLHVWSAGAAMLKPDEIIDLLFTIQEEFNCVFLGVEETGLHEWLNQPIRQEQARRGVVLPYVAVKAFRGDGQVNFIRGLQPFYANGEVTHNDAFPELEEQLLGFPTGKRDAPNALAYALTMRPGALVYDNFSLDHIDADLFPLPSRPLFLAANATQTVVCACLLQVVDGQLRVYADWVLEGTPDMCVADIFSEAALEGDAASSRHAREDSFSARRLLGTALHEDYNRLPLRWVVPPRHSDQWNNVGLIQAIAHIPAVVSQGALETSGREVFRGILESVARGRLGLVVSERAKWTLRAFTGGYCYAAAKGGGLAPQTVDSPYKVLMEGLESFAGMIARGADEEDDDSQNWSYNRAGQRYLSAMPERSPR